MITREVLTLKGCRVTLPRATVCLMTQMLTEKQESTIIEDPNQSKQQ